jgi:hypothetical protein
MCYIIKYISIATLEPPLSTKAAIGMTFLTIVPAIIFGAFVVYSYANHLKRLFNFITSSSRSSIIPTTTATN